MNKVVKYGLYGVGGVIAVSVIGIGYIAATFDPNAYKGEIIQAVKENTERNLTLEGDIALTFFPNIGADLGKVSLSEYQSDETFVSIESASVSLALMPLFSKQIVVNDIAVDGLNAVLVKRKDGSTNIDDLLGASQSQNEAQSSTEPESSQPVALDIASVHVKNTELTYIDQAAGAEYGVSELNLQTGRIAMDAPTDIELSARVKASEPRVDLQTSLKTTVQLNLPEQRYQLDDLRLNVQGQAIDIQNLELALSSDQLQANLPDQQYALQQMKLTASGARQSDQFVVDVSLPGLTMDQQTFEAEQFTANAHLDGQPGNIKADLTVPQLGGSLDAIATEGFQLNANLKQDAMSVEAEVTSPLALNIKQQQLTLEDLRIALQASGDQLPGKTINSEMKGQLSLDALKETLQAQLAGGLLQSQVDARVSVSQFAQPAVDFDVSVDQFDADLYLPQEKEAPETAQSDEPEQPIDLSALKTLNVKGKLSVGDLKAARIKAQNLKLNMVARQGRLTVHPLTADLYQGRMNGRIAVDAREVPEISVEQKLTNISVAPLTKDAIDMDKLEGRGNINLDVNMTGDRVSVMKKQMNGRVTLNLRDGAIKGINVAQTIRDAKSLFGKGSKTVEADETQKTDFSELIARFDIKNGVAHNDDLLLKSPLLRLTGEGQIDIGQDQMNYLAKATLAKTLKGQDGEADVSGVTVPVRIKGPFDDLKYRLDFEEMFKAEAKRKVEAKVEEKKQEVMDKVQEKVKGLFDGLF